MSEFVLEREGVRLAGIDFGGEGQLFVLLHGLAGYAGEWAQTASWLRRRGRVVALDARGHGGSERLPADVSRRAHVDDVVFAARELGLGELIVIGQSMGGHTAILLADADPALVRALVLADAGPSDGDADAVSAVVGEVGASLRRWPVPFPTKEAAVAHFGGESLRREAWAGGLEHRDDGWWPRFDVEVMLQTLQEALTESSWNAWEGIVDCPLLLAWAEKGIYTAEDVQAMAQRGRDVTLVEIMGARHDLHLDRPAAWQAAVSEFLDGLERA